MTPRWGDVYDARLAPVEGSEQAGTRPVVVVSRDALNRVVPRVIVVPCTTFREGRTVYPSQALLPASAGGLTRDSVALGDQVRTIAVSRLVHRRGQLSADAMRRLEQALLVAFDLGDRY